MPGPMGRPPRGVKPTVANPGKIFMRLMKLVFKGNALKWIFIVACIVLSVQASVQGMLFTQTLIDKHITPALAGGTSVAQTLPADILRVALILAGGFLAGYLQQLVQVFLTQGTMQRIRDKMFEHMESLPIGYFDSHAHGDIMSMYTNDVDTFRQMVSQSIPQLVNSTITIVSVLVSMIILNGWLTLLSMFLVGVMIFTTKKISGLSGKYFVKQQRDLGAVNGYIEEMITGQKVVKVFCHEEESVKGFKTLNDSLCDSAYNANRYANLIGPINMQMSNVNYVIVAVAGAALAMGGVGGFTLGGLAAFLSLNKSFSMPINQISMQFASIIMSLAGADRVFKLMDEKPETDDGYVTLVNVEAGEAADGKLVESSERTGRWAWKHFHKATGETDYVELKGDVVFDGVDFGYVPEKQVLYDIKLFAKPGQKIAFVGSTGAGKTTITNLINRFYDIQDGKIRYDGINVNKIKKDDLRHSLGIVLQDTHLFTGTVADNIRYGKLDATDEEVVAAAKLANAHSFIKKLPKGYDTELKGDGANLSQGQRQLLSIARAAIADPPVLILDEATSSIDTRTEKIVQRGMDSLMKGRTTFVIAHRLSTVQNSDCIMVLEQGRIVERGTHDELIEQKGRYYKLYTGNSIA